MTLMGRVFLNNLSLRTQEVEVNGATSRGVYTASTSMAPIGID